MKKVKIFLKKMFGGLNIAFLIMLTFVSCILYFGGQAGITNLHESWGVFLFVVYCLVFVLFLYALISQIIPQMFRYWVYGWK